MERLISSVAVVIREQDH